MDRNQRSGTVSRAQNVALLAEGVDRNLCRMLLLVVCLASPSSRRAWIETFRMRLSAARGAVALLAEGVDRNKHRNKQRVTAVSVALLAEGVDRNSRLQNG